MTVRWEAGGLLLAGTQVTHINQEEEEGGGGRPARLIVAFGTFYSSDKTRRPFLNSSISAVQNVSHVLRFEMV